MAECLILFGAGASKGNGECFPERPPLGSELLDALHSFNQNLWPASTGLDASQNSTIQASFEKWMDEKIRTGFEIVPYQKSLAIFFSRYSAIGDNNCYNRVIRALKGQLMRNKTALATLNYDLLLDRALSRDLGFVNYDDNGRPPHLIKVHGSCNWLVEHQMLNIRGEFKHEIKGSDYGKFDFPPLCIFDEPIKMRNRIQEDKLPPIMRIFASTKPSPTGTGWLRKQENRLRAGIQEARRIVIVGARPNDYDHHIWGEILKADADVAIVAPDPLSKEWLKERGNNKDLWINTRFEESCNDLVRMTKRGWRY